MWVRELVLDYDAAGDRHGLRWDSRKLSIDRALKDVLTRVLPSWDA